MAPALVMGASAADEVEQCGGPRDALDAAVKEARVM
jgi:hypothetical protein